MLRFVVGFAAGWIAKKWLDEEIDKNKFFAVIMAILMQLRISLKTLKRSFLVGI